MGNCKACQWWDPINEAKGICRRYPPRPVCSVWSEGDEYDDRRICTKSDIDNYWPGTGWDDYCGEFSAGK